MRNPHPAETRRSGARGGRGLLRHDGRGRGSLKRGQCARGQQGLTTLDFQRHKLYFQADLLSFGLLALQFDFRSLLKFGIEGAAMRKFGIVHHAVGRNGQYCRLLDYLTDSWQALNRPWCKHLILSSASGMFGFVVLLRILRVALHFGFCKADCDPPGA